MASVSGEVEAKRQRVVSELDCDNVDVLLSDGSDEEAEKEIEQWIDAYACGKDTSDGQCTTLGACCQAFKDNALPITLKAKWSKIKAKDKASVAMIKNLVLHAEPKDGAAAASSVPDLSNWEWNGQCGCGQPAARRTSQWGVEYYCCYFGPCDDARCSLKYKELEGAPVIASHGGSKWP